MVTSAVMIAGCAPSEPSAEENAKIEASLQTGGNPENMTPEQRKAFDEYMKNRGTSQPGSAPAPAPAPSGN